MADGGVKRQSADWPLLAVLLHGSLGHFWSLQSSGVFLLGALDWSFMRKDCHVSVFGLPFFPACRNYGSMEWVDKVPLLRSLNLCSLTYSVTQTCVTPPSLKVLTTSPLQLLMLPLKIWLEIG